MKQARRRGHTARFTLGMRWWLFINLTVFMMLGAAATAALILGNRESNIANEAERALAQALQQTRSELRRALDPPLAAATQLRDWLAAGALDPADPAASLAVAAPLLRANPALREIAIAPVNGAAALRIQALADGWLTWSAQPGTAPGRVLEQRWSLDAVSIEDERWNPEEWDPRRTESFAGAMERFLERRDTNRAGRPTLYWRLPEGEGAGTLEAAFAVRTNPLQDVAVILQLDAGLMQTALANIEARQGAVHFALWDGQRLAGQWPRPPSSARWPSIGAAHHDGIAHLVRLWQSTGPNQRPERFSFTLDGRRFWGGIEEAPLHPGTNLHYGALISSGALLPGHQELIIGLGVLSVAGLVIAAAGALALGRSLLKPVRALAGSLERTDALDWKHAYWPKTRLTELKRMLEAADAFRERAAERLREDDAARESASRDPAERLREWAGRPMLPPATEPEAPAPETPSPSEAPAARSLPPAAYVQALETARRQLRAAREELEQLYARLNETGARNRAMGRTLEGIRATLLALAHSPRLDPGNEHALEDFARMAVERLGAGAVSVWRLCADPPALEWAGAHSRDEANGAHKTPESIPRRENSALFTALEVEAALHVPGGARNEDSAAPPASAFHDAPDAALLVAPVHAAGRLLGAIVFIHAQGPRDWTPEEDAFALALAQVAARLLAPRTAPAPEVPSAPAPPDAAETPEILELALRESGAAAIQVDAPQALAAAAGAVIWETDAIGCIERIEGALEPIYGYAAEELIGRPWTVLSAPARAADDVERLAELMSGGTLPPETAEHLRKDGSIVRVLLQLRVRLDLNGEASGITGIVLPLNETSALATEEKET